MARNLIKKNLYRDVESLDAEDMELTTALDEDNVEEKNGYYIDTLCNDKYNNEKSCEELYYLWEDEVEPLQPYTEWAKMVALYNQLLGTDYEAGEVTVEEMAEFTETNNYFKFNG